MFCAFGLLIALFRLYTVMKNVFPLTDMYTSNLSTHFRYWKYKFCVYFGINISIGIDRYQTSKYLYIELKILLSPITNIWFRRDIFCCIIYIKYVCIFTGLQPKSHTYNPGQNICDTSNYLTKCCNIIVNLEPPPLGLMPTIQCWLHS
jgi:hypothetical protein